MKMKCIYDVKWRVTLGIITFMWTLFAVVYLAKNINENMLSWSMLVVYFNILFAGYGPIFFFIIEPYNARPIEVDEEGIRNYIMGRLLKSIRWEDIVKIKLPQKLYVPYKDPEYAWREQKISITSRDGTKIYIYNQILWWNWRGKSTLADRFAIEELVYQILTRVNFEYCEIEEYKGVVFKRIVSKSKIYPTAWAKLNESHEKREKEENRNSKARAEMDKIRKLFGN